MFVSSLFSGAGGLDIGLHQAGHELVMLCESDPGARQVLKETFPGVLVAEDISTVQALPALTELVAAGFPCVDVSKAGRRAGMDGLGTSLVRHVFRLLRQAKQDGRPVQWVLLENVEAVLDRHGDQAPVMAFVTSQLQELGYCSWAYRLVASAGMGVPNRRRRVFVVASLHGDARDVLLSQGALPCPGSCMELFGGRRCYPCHQKILEQRKNDAAVAYAVDLGNAVSGPAEDVVPTFTTSNQRILLLLPDGRTGLLRVEDAERLQQLPEGHTKACYPVAPAGVAAHRSARPKDIDAQLQTSRRWDLLGNAVTAGVGRWLGERLANPYAYKYHGIGCNDRRMDGLLQDGADGAGKPTPAPNVWSFVCADELQEAVLFPFTTPPMQQETLLPGQAAAAVAAASAPGGHLCSGDSCDNVDSEDEDVEIVDPHPRPCAIVGANSDGVPAYTRKVAAAANTSGNAQTGIAAAEEGNGSGAEEQDEVARQDQIDMFQASLVERAGRGQLPGTSRCQRPWDKSSWPRCGWWVRGQGAFAVEGMSDCPVLAPFQPLGDFIQHVGRPHTQEEAASYIHRMKERGWELSKALLERLHGKKALGEFAKITRLPGLLSDGDMVGHIVWAWDSTARVHWPGEVLDPLAMPPGRELPPGSMEQLTSPAHRRASLQCTDGSYNPLQESALNRRVLVLYLPFPSKAWEWLNPADLEPWELALAQREREAGAAGRRDNGKWRYREALRCAIRDAKSSYALKQGGRGAEVDRMRETRAAAAAAGVDLKRRCQACRTCMDRTAGARRYECLTQRMMAAALSGHAGAQVAALGERAAGARLAVWWDGDQRFFEGVVTLYDAVSTQHTIAYDDGEVAMHRLWQHDERIRCLNSPGDWPQEGAAARARLRAGSDKLHAACVEREQAAAQAAALASAEAAMAQVVALTDYERQREANIHRNRRVMGEMIPSSLGGQLGEYTAGQDSGAGGPAQGAGTTAVGTKRAVPHKCGECRACLNPKLKKGCVQVVRGG